MKTTILLLLLSISNLTYANDGVFSSIEEKLDMDINGGVRVFHQIAPNDIKVANFVNAAVYVNAYKDFNKYVSFSGRVDLDNYNKLWVPHAFLTFSSLVPTTEIEIGIDVGIVRSDMFLYNAARNSPSSNIASFPPQSIYWTVIDNLGISSLGVKPFIKYKGLFASYTKGTPMIPNDDMVGNLFDLRLGGEVAGFVRHGDPDNIESWAIGYRGPSLYAKYSHFSIDIPFSFATSTIATNMRPFFPPASLEFNQNLTVDTVGVEYAINDYTMSYEYMQVTNSERKKDGYNPGHSVTVTTPTPINNVYLSLNYNQYELKQTTNSEVPEGLQKSTDANIGLIWDKGDWLFKIDYHSMTGGLWTDTSNRQKVIDRGGDRWSVIGLSVDYTF